MTESKTLTEALAAFQSELPSVAKNGENPHFRSQFATLEDISAKVLPLLAKHGLAWTACPDITDTGMTLKYALRHVLGESIEGAYPLGAVNAQPQQIGSAITYARRYALLAVTGVAPGGDDDDAEGAQKAHKPAPKDWLAQVNGASSMSDLQALNGRAVSEGWKTPDVSAALNRRRGELNATTNTAASE